MLQQCSQGTATENGNMDIVYDCENNLVAKREKPGYDISPCTQDCTFPAFLYQTNLTNQTERCRQRRAEYLWCL